MADTKYELTDGAGSPMDLCLSVNVHILSYSPDNSLAHDEHTFNTIGTSGTVTNVGGHFIVHGDYNACHKPSKFNKNHLINFA